MGRNNRYETHVKPRLKEIQEWFTVCSEEQIAKKLGISVRSFERYKKDNPELREALKRGKEELVADLKSSLKRKALGFEYTEAKKQITEVNGKRRVVIEEYTRYVQPDTGAIHLLLKNLDDSWHNDDKTTISMKREKLELEKQKAEDSNW